MRTTLSIADHLITAAEDRAARRRETLGQFVEEAIRSRLAELDSPPGDRAVELLSVPGAPAPGVDLTSNRAIFDFLDEGGPETWSPTPTSRPSRCLSLAPC
jgi:hypothetical protein